MRILAGHFQIVQIATESYSMTLLLEIVLPHCLSVSLGIKSGDDGRDLEGTHAILEEIGKKKKNQTISKGKSWSIIERPPSKWVVQG